VAGSVQPGKYLVLVDGDVASVEEALRAGEEAGAPTLVDRMFLPDVHPAVGNAVAGARWTGEIDTLGVIETRTTPSVLHAADAAMKGAEVSLVEIRLANGLGGKAIALFAGAQHDVEAALEIGSGRVEPGNLLHTALVPRLHHEMAENIHTGTRFAAQWDRSEG
jgi:microcompartment protein CcmL/EutN